MSPENSEFFEVTCLDCKTTKSYFTAQGVSFFKMNHEGHKVEVKVPTGSPAEAEPEPMPESASEPVAMAPSVEAAPAVVRGEPTFAEPVMGPVRLGNLVVDVVEEEKGLAVKVYGIAGGHESFAKEFKISEVAELNSFLESGSYADADSRTTYTWSPDKIDLSTDVAKMLEEPQPAPEAKQAEAQPVTPAVVQSDVEPEPVEELRAPIPSAVHAAHDISTKGPTEDLLLGKLSYLQEGDEVRAEALRISKTLRKYRWNTEPPYVIGAIFDDLMSIQSQTGMIKAAAIDSMVALGYSFVAIEAPAGVVTAWFKKNGGAQAEQEDEPLEFGASTA